MAAAESSEPERAVARAMKSIVLRIIGFYVGSILVVVTVIPWDAKSVGVSPTRPCWRRWTSPPSPPL